MNNLVGLPTVNCITLENSEHRRNFLLKQFEKYDLNHKFYYAYDAITNNLSDIANVTSPYLFQMNEGEICAVISHLKAIFDWYNTTDEEYGFFCEDDVLLSLNENWTFTWEEFITNLPKGWGSIQLSLIRYSQFEENDLNYHMKFNPYVWDNWSACAYLMSRDYVKKLIEYHYRGEDNYDLNLPYFPQTTPYIENVLYNADNKESAYTIPLFVENSDFNSYFYPKFRKIDTEDVKKYCSNLINNWWKTNSKDKSLEWFFNRKPIKIIDPEEEMRLTLKVNPDYKKDKRIFIVDNFYENPDAVREFALNQEYFDDPGYVGRRTRRQYLPPGIKEAFEEIMNHKITRWEDHGMNGRFQHNWAGESLVYHCDAQTWAAIIYLTPDAPPECGTSTWRHKKTKIHHNNQIDWANGKGVEVFNQRTFVDRTPYEPVDVCGNIYNRLVIFSGGCIHSASEYFGDCLENCRLWHMFFFD